ncbi:XK-related protein 2 [Nerophis lumbriciformis]|uniref:XK-related protein 2 n=1 Tax=Nerophis lumbriciformis TaxID=546530 RepID=UPI002AE0A28B|nr:endoplasmic reticulum membrane adapter protein XK-like [Nerophis lumbriciformis]
MEEREREREDMLVVSGSKVRAPLSVVFATLLYCAELINAAILCRQYSRTDDTHWLAFTLTFMLLPAVLIQMTLIFIHRDVGRDRPLVLLLHLLLLGPLIRCFDALVVYFKAGKVEEPYVTITRKIFLGRGHQRTWTEYEISRSQRILATHKNAFKRTSVIQAFLGSTPQLTLQLYAAILEKSILSVRLSLMIITKVSIIYGALVCSVLAIQVCYDDYKVRFRKLAYLCMVLWRGLEIATRITTLVLMSTALNHWVILVGVANLLFFFFLPWAELWAKKGSLAEDVEKNFSKLGTVVVLSAFTLLYACINVFCWSAVQLDLGHPELLDRKQRWDRLAAYYSVRFVENLLLITLWYFFKSDFYEYVCAPLLALQLLVCYSLAVLFMLLFYQYLHPCRRLFSHNVLCCRQHHPEAGKMAPSYSAAATMVLMSDEPVALLDPPDSHLQETTILDDLTEYA